MIIYNCKIHTPNEVIENGFVATNGGRISEVGRGYTAVHGGGNGGGVIDGEGMNLYPAFIDAHCHVGIIGDGQGAEGDDCNEVSDPITPHLRAVDGVNPADRCFGEAFRAGVSVVCTGIGSANPIGGNFVTMRTYGGLDIDSRVITANAGIKFAFGENPKRCYDKRDETPMTRLAVAAVIREALKKAERYGAAAAKAEGKTENDEELPDPPEYDIKCEALLPLLRREIPAFAHCHRLDDIFTALRIAREFNIRVVLVHATEAHLGNIPPEIPLIAGPLICGREKPELINHDIAMPQKLYENGNAVAVCTDASVVPIQYLPLSAGAAVRGGMSVTAALDAITRVPARILGIDGDYGSIEVGKIADFTLWRGDFYDITQSPARHYVCDD